MDFIFRVRNRKRGDYALQENKGGNQIRTGGSVRTKEEAGKT